MNPYYKIGLIVSVFVLLLQLAGYVYFFGFFRGTYEQFKESTTASLRRLEGVFFTDVKVVPHSAEQLGDAEPVIHRRKR